MYVLEHLTYCGNKQRPQYVWTPYVFCGKRKILDKVRRAQSDPRHWRIIRTALTYQQYGRHHLFSIDRKAS